MGVKKEIDDKFIYLSRTSDLIPQDIQFTHISHSVTLATVMLLASLDMNKGIEVRNIYQGIELDNLIELLEAGGATIERNSSRITIQGVNSLKQASIETVPDRVELGSYILGGIATRGTVFTRKRYFEFLDSSFVDTISSIGCEVIEKNDYIFFKIGNPFQHFGVIADNKGGFHSDLQNLLIPIASLCNDKSIITDCVFDNRFRQYDDYVKAGVLCEISENSMKIYPSKLNKGDQYFFANDIRGGFSLIILGLILSTTSNICIDNSQVIIRGYERIVEKFRDLGVEIREEVIQ